MSSEDRDHAIQVLRMHLYAAERKILSKEFHDRSLKDEVDRQKLEIDRLKWTLNYKVNKLTKEKEEIENELTCLRKSYSVLESKFNTVKAKCLNFFGLDVTD